MPYRRFLREAEPFKVSNCGSCDARLKRSPKVFVYLLLMLVVLAATSIPLFLGMVEARLSYWVIWPLTIVWLAAWVMLTNYLSWRYIGWVMTDVAGKA